MPETLAEILNNHRQSMAMANIIGFTTAAAANLLTEI